MSRFSRYATLIAVVLMGSTLSGCVVLPFGGGHGRYERDGGHRDGGRDGSRDHGDPDRRGR